MSPLMRIVLHHVALHLGKRAAELDKEAAGIEENGEVQGSNREAKTLRTIAQEYRHLAKEITL